MKDKNYQNSRGAGDGDLSAGLLGMMQGGGAMEYPEMMMNGGSSGSMTYAQKAQLEKAQPGKEISSGSSEAKKRMSGFKYPEGLKTAGDSTSYKVGYESGKKIIGGGKAGITANPNYEKGYKAGSKKPKK